MVRRGSFLSLSRKLTCMPYGLAAMISSIPPLVTRWKVWTGDIIRSRCLDGRKRTGELAVVKFCRGSLTWGRMYKDFVFEGRDILKHLVKYNAQLLVKRRQCLEQFRAEEARATVRSRAAALCQSLRVLSTSISYLTVNRFEHEFSAARLSRRSCQLESPHHFFYANSVLSRTTTSGALIVLFVLVEKTVPPRFLKIDFDEGVGFWVPSKIVPSRQNIYKRFRTLCSRRTTDSFQNRTQPASILCILENYKNISKMKWSIHQRSTFSNNSCQPLTLGIIPASSTRQPLAWLAQEKAGKERKRLWKLLFHPYNRGRIGGSPNGSFFIFSNKI